jgi:topoisomerase-4 subunit B
VFYARDEAHRDELLRSEFSGRGKVEISRFKGLGEMPMQQLRDTTMDPAKRTLLQVEIVNDEIKLTQTMVQRLMGNKPEERFAFIQERAAFAGEELIDL